MKAELASGLLMFALCQSAIAAGTEPGLMAAYSLITEQRPRPTCVSGESNVRLYVPEGDSPTPFLPAGRFEATWNGFVSVELRSEFSFQAEVGGAFKLEINGESVLEFSGDGQSSSLSKPVRLNKGTNALRAILVSPAKGDTFVRLRWTDNETAIRPLPNDALSRPSELPLLAEAEQLRLGRELTFEYRCLRCHAAPASSRIPDAMMDAPSFEGIGSRRNFHWLARWILDPKALRPSARMPRMLHGTDSRKDAEAIAAFLASLKAAKAERASEYTDEQVDAGRQRFETLLCGGCHAAPGEVAEEDSAKISLSGLKQKFAPGALAAFLLEPERHYEWIRMPNFKLTDAEAAELAGYLWSGAEEVPEAAPSDLAFLEEGRKLVQNKGCLNCHQLGLQNQFEAPSLAGLKNWKNGCLAEARPEGSKAPQFLFSESEREALRAFGGSDRTSLARYVPSAFADRQARGLQCAACHGQHEGFPAFEILGGKLKPEWMEAFLAGEMPYKPRPWLEARMPEFKRHAAGLAHGMAAQHGFPPRTLPEPPIDLAAAEVGRKLVGKEGGFSCISCHAVRSMPATEVFEAEGINLAYSAERLLPPYYKRWLLDPLLIDPQTKMPDYFEGWSSVLTEYYEGDAPKQIDAMWQYLRLGDKMPLPNSATP